MSDLDRDKLKSVSAGFKSNVGSDGAKGFIQKVKGLFGGDDDQSDLMKKAMQARKEKIAMK